MRGATVGAVAAHPATEFQSTPPCGGRRCLSAMSSPRVRFQSTAPVRGATRSKSASWPPSMFHPRPRAGGDRWTGFAITIRWMFQSTPPCGGATRGHSCRRSTDNVSIHAPVRGRRRPARDNHQPRRVSIHAPVRGAT